VLLSEFGFMPFARLVKELFPIDAKKKEKVAVLSLSQKVAEKDKV
jgi:hypothetical protein